MRQLRSDRGSSIIPVLAIAAIGVVVSGMLSSSIVGGLTFTNSTRSDVQAQASADAGVAAARAGLYAGNCGSQPTTATYAATTGSVRYSAKVQRLVSGAWQDGCPASLSPQVRVVSTGRAVNAAGNIDGDPVVVEAIFNFLWPGVTPSGVGMYLYGGGTVEANASLDLSESSGGGLVIKNGNFVCAKNNSVLNGDVVIIGNLDFQNKDCAINGNASVSGSVALGSHGSISGDLTAGSVSPNPPGSKVGGTYTQSAAIPASAPWTDVAYTPADWVDSTGIPYQIVTLSGSSCTQPGGNFGGLGGAPTIINALACSSGIQVTNNTTFKLTSDVVIFAPKFSWGAINQLNFASSDSTKHKLWFITPDTTVDAIPTCSAALGNFAINNSFQIQSPIDAMLYTPCAFDGTNGFVWRGQLYAGGYSNVKNNPAFTYAQVGIAGHNLETGGPTNTVLTPTPGSLISNRNVTP